MSRSISPEAFESSDPSVTEDQEPMSDATHTINEGPLDPLSKQECLNIVTPLSAERLDTVRSKASTLSSEQLAAAAEITPLRTDLPGLARNNHELNLLPEVVRALQGEAAYVTEDNNPLTKGNEPLLNKITVLGVKGRRADGSIMMAVWDETLGREKRMGFNLNQLRYTDEHSEKMRETILASPDAQPDADPQTVEHAVRRFGENGKVDQDTRAQLDRTSDVRGKSRTMPVKEQGRSVEAHRSEPKRTLRGTRWLSGIKAKPFE